MRDVRVRSRGSGTPSVLLLHGLGATADVWDGLVLTHPDPAHAPPAG